jgi:hypothetical protein
VHASKDTPISLNPDPQTPAGESFVGKKSRPDYNAARVTWLATSKSALTLQIYRRELKLGEL